MGFYTESGVYSAPGNGEALLAIISGTISPGSGGFENARVLIADGDNTECERFTDAINGMGCQNVSAVNDLATLKSTLAPADQACPADAIIPDLIIIDEQITQSLGSFIDAIRHGRIGSNPFVVIIVTTRSVEGRHITSLIRQGADDVIVKPITARTLGERIEYVAIHRRPFIVTSDYVGPDRRLDDDRPSTIDQLAVPNTLLQQITGEPTTDGGAGQTIKNAVEAIIGARLEQHAQSLGVLSHLVLEAHFDQQASEDNTAGSKQIRGWFRVMLSLLRDIQRIGEQLDNLAMVELARSLREQIQMIARHTGQISDMDVMLLKDLVEAVKMTIGLTALPNPDIINLAKTYQKHGQQPIAPQGPIVLPSMLPPGDSTDS